MHGEFLRLIFLQAHRETEDYFRFTGVSAQPSTDLFRYRRAAFYSGLKSKVGLIAAKTAALRVKMMMMMFIGTETLVTQLVHEMQAC